MVFEYFSKTGPERRKMLDSTLPRAKMEFSVLIREPRWPKLFMNITYYELGFYHKNFKWKRVRELLLPAQSFGLRKTVISGQRQLETIYDYEYDYD